LNYFDTIATLLLDATLASPLFVVCVVYSFLSPIEYIFDGVHLFYILSIYSTIHRFLLQLSSIYFISLHAYFALLKSLFNKIFVAYCGEKRSYIQKEGRSPLLSPYANFSTLTFKHFTQNTFIFSSFT